MIYVVAEAAEINIDKLIVDPVLYLELVVEPALFKAVPLQTAKL